MLRLLLRLLWRSLHYSIKTGKACLGRIHQQRKERLRRLVEAHTTSTATPTSTEAEEAPRQPRRRRRPRPAQRRIEPQGLQLDGNILGPVAQVDETMHSSGSMVKVVPFEVLSLVCRHSSPAEIYNFRLVCTRFRDAARVAFCQILDRRSFVVNCGTLKELEDRMDEFSAGPYIRTLRLAVEFEVACTCQSKSPWLCNTKSKSVTLLIPESQRWNTHSAVLVLKESPASRGHKAFSGGFQSWTPLSYCQCSDLLRRQAVLAISMALHYCLRQIRQLGWHLACLCGPSRGSYSTDQQRQRSEGSHSMPPSASRIC